eukprot:TRINITY_DN15533_c0_g1_i1.p1 TRINITY_DN15533_c0_g1~~TRINITY_DN15533_c0_g1_i1.p1  ORF type:complete len:150 (-),score=22.45 TRINITY_DN15533_c0_g1_i1:182-631(-)
MGATLSNSSNSMVMKFMYFRVLPMSRKVMHRQFKSLGLLYMVKNFSHSDVALLELKEKLDYTSGIMPICLPQPPFDKDEDMDVWISGYNFHFHRKVPKSQKCRTTGGPNKNSMCKFPFKQRFKNHSTTHMSCVSQPSPATQSVHSCRES